MPTNPYPPLQNHSLPVHNPVPWPMPQVPSQQAATQSSQMMQVTQENPAAWHPLMLQTSSSTYGPEGRRQQDQITSFQQQNAGTVDAVQTHVNSLNSFDTNMSRTVDAVQGEFW